MNTIRLLQIIPTLVRGGAEKQLLLLATRLPPQEFEVHVCLLSAGGPYLAELQQRGIPVHEVGKRGKVDPAAYLRLRRIIRELRPALVHTWIFAANSYGRQAAWDAGVRRLVAGERCVDPWKRWHELAIDRYLARRTARIVTNSSGVREFYTGHGIPAEKFSIIPNAIELPPPPEVSREQALRELGLPASARVIAAVGRLWPQKRHKDLIWAADLLKCVRDDIHLLIAGDGPERERLIRYRDGVRICDRVHFLGERADVPRWLPHVDCLWLASGYEGQSNAVMEAMSCGVPVVATDIPGNRDLVVAGETGYLVPVGDRRGFARWTQVLLEDEPLRQRMGEAGRRRMLREFSVEQMVQRHVDLYRELMANPASSL